MNDDFKKSIVKISIKDISLFNTFSRGVLFEKSFRYIPLNVKKVEENRLLYAQGNFGFSRIVSI